MQPAIEIASLPQVPCVYALISGTPSNRNIAYVGITGNLRVRIKQHLIDRDSSISTGTSAAMLNPDYVTEIQWWTSPIMKSKIGREAAEIIALDILQPTLQSRGSHSRAARAKSRTKPFVDDVTKLITSNSTGSLSIPTLVNIVSRLSELEERLDRLENSPRSTRAI